MSIPSFEHREIDYAACSVGVVPETPSRRCWTLARWWPGVLPVGQLVSGVTPLPTVAWVRRMLSPAVIG